MDISSDKDVYHQGEIPKIEIRITNKSNKTLSLITNLDGSSDSIRYPISLFKVFCNDTLVRPQIFLRCGNLDGISRELVISLKPGESMDPQNDAPWIYQDHFISDPVTFERKGKYCIEYYYSTNQDTLSEWVGWNSYMNFFRPEADRDSLINAYKRTFNSVPRAELKGASLRFVIK